VQAASLQLTEEEYMDLNGVAALAS
jgi:hypothetical protein